MKTYALITNGRVFEIIPPALWDDGTEIDISDRYTPEFIADLIDITNTVPMPIVGMVYANGMFSEYVEPPPTPEQILTAASFKLQQLTQLAAAQKTALTNRVGTLLDAVELEMATPEEVAELPVRQTQLLDWKRYAVFLGRVTSQAGWPPEVDWPVQPAAGMDLSVSAVAKSVKAS